MVQSMKLVLALIIWKLVVGKYIPSYQTQHYHGNTHASSDLTRDKTMRKKRYNIFKSNLVCKFFNILNNYQKPVVYVKLEYLVISRQCVSTEGGSFSN